MAPDKQRTHKLNRQLDSRGTFAIDNFIIRNIYNQCQKKLTILLRNRVVLWCLRIPNYINGILIIQFKILLQRTADDTKHKQEILAVTCIMQSLSDSYTINIALC